MLNHRASSTLGRRHIWAIIIAVGPSGSAGASPFEALGVDEGESLDGERVRISHQYSCLASTPWLLSIPFPVPSLRKEGSAGADQSLPLGAIS